MVRETDHQGDLVDAYEITHTVVGLLSVFGFVSPGVDGGREYGWKQATARRPPADSNLYGRAYC
jgi:hypothetical protein